ncbi:MAG: peptidase [Gemmatimonadetes bacterium]|nr:peptidase [Gemmatimonadota bacterium]
MRHARLLRSLPLAATLSATTLGAQQVMAGYTPAAAQRQKDLEVRAIAVPTPERSSAHSRTLSKEAHVAGTPAQARTRDYVIAQMKSWGMETEVRSYDVFLPHPTAVHVWRLSPSPRELPLAEPAVPGDPSSALSQYPTVNGTSGTGDVRGEVVYVNYGLIEDYALLDSLHVSVRGKIAVARYGRSFRGIKAREAEKHGALALIIYSDPSGDGYASGDVYPEGPNRNDRGVQRGSVFNGNGDPTTPGYPSTAGAKRLDPSVSEVPKIPVVPMSYGNAAELLKGVRGHDLPPGWQGALPFRYHVGPGPVQARVQVRDDRATKGLKPIYDTFGIVRGSEFPDEIVMVGGHRDAWGPGAADNVSGTVSVLEAARAMAELVKGGVRPRRTMVFATWDAEEWGLVGSTEYVEEDSLRLARGGVAYLNQDVSAQGSHFGGGGSPSLRGVLRDVTKAVRDPNSGKSVYAQWRLESAVADSAEPAMDDPGGGSDYAGFYNHVGMPIAEWGFGGGGGVYHSQYDDYAWMSKFGDPGFRYHAAAAQLGAAMMLRLANADIIPYDYAEYATTMLTYLPALDRVLARRSAGVGTGALHTAIDAMHAAGAAFNASRDSALAGGAQGVPLARVNSALREVERALTRGEGLRSRPWFRNLIYAADEDNGYANVVFPSVSEALKGGDASLTQREMADLVQRFDSATAALHRARAAIGGR